MFLGMAIRTNQFQIIQTIVVSVFILVVNLQYLKLSKSTSFAFFSSDF